MQLSVGQAIAPVDHAVDLPMAVGAGPGVAMDLQLRAIEARVEIQFAQRHIDLVGVDLAVADLEFAVKNGRSQGAGERQVGVELTADPIDLLRRRSQ